jgi:hypothetical protein
MERLKAEGFDFSDPNGSETFGRRLMELDEDFRSADREVRALEHGDYPHAEIDRSGDFLTGRYVEDGSTTGLTIARGLKSYRDERELLGLKLEGEEVALSDLRADMARLDGMRSVFAERQRRAGESVTEAIAAAADLYAELNRVDAEAFAIEQTGLDLLERSAAASRAAAGHADRWIRDARDHTQGLSSEATARSAFGGRLRDGWIRGHIAAQEADSRLSKAWIYYERYRAYTQNADILADVTDTLQLREADLESERVKTQEAHDAGLEEIKSAMGVLKSVHGKTESHWTVTAQAAGTTYVLALFGHEAYVDETIQAYRNSIKGREDMAFAQPFVARLNRLERRR